MGDVKILVPEVPTTCSKKTIRPFPQDTNASLPGRSRGFSDLATIPTCLLMRTQYCRFGLEDWINNYFSFIRIPVHYFSYDIYVRAVNEDSVYPATSDLDCLVMIALTRSLKTDRVSVLSHERARNKCP